MAEPSPTEFQPPRFALIAGEEPIAGYRLVRRLGRGGFGEVWLATSPGDYRVALKFLQLDHSTGQVENKHLQHLKSLRHAHLLPIFGAWERDGFLILAMELADRTLADELQACQSRGLAGIPGETLFEYMRDVAKGIDYLNDHEIVHRDIKPQNLLLVGDGVKVADFGLVKLMDQTLAANSGGYTVRYAAPELFQGRVSRSVDQYALAVSYCELRGSRLPFDGTVYELMAQHERTAPNLSMLPEPERPAVAKALAKSPNDRWATCREFVNAITGAMTPVASVMADPLSTWRRQILTAHTEPEMRRILYEVEGYLGRDPHSVEAKLLRDQIRSAMASQTPVSAVPPARPDGMWLNRPPARAARRAAWLAATVCLMIGIAAPVYWLSHSAVKLSSMHESQPTKTDRPPALDSAGGALSAATVQSIQQQWADYLGKKVVQEFDIDGRVKMQFVLIPPGQFLMGAPDGDSESAANEKPQHVVQITKPFFMATTPVTVRQFAAFVEAKNYRTDAETDRKGDFGYNAETNEFEGGQTKYIWKNTGWPQTDDHPVVNVSHSDAAKFCDWLNETLKELEARLPTEAESEFVLRAGTTTRFSTGSDGRSLEGFANVSDDSLRRRAVKGLQGVFFEFDDGEPFSSPVGRYKSNALGLRDMTGNVWHWCFDDTRPFTADPASDPMGPTRGSIARAYRGGGWGASPRECRVTSRGRVAASFRNYLIGFRPVLVSPQKPR